MSLRAWADVVLRRHGGRFATHHIFAFLVFNMSVRSKNRRVSVLSVTRKSFRKAEGIIQSLSAERLAAARVDLESSGKTTDEAVKELLRSLSLYGFRQPMSRESRLSMRRKIQSLILRYGVPVIWFTLNPNDITNPVKLRLAAYRTREPDAAEAFLKSLDMSYKRVRLAISDPMSSAIFFHREMTLFFEHYVKVGGESVFGRISHYYGAVETNERGALHIHGLLWLHGNSHLSSMVPDTGGEDQATCRDRIIQYIDSVFSEDLDQEAFCAVQAERSVTSDISSLLGNREQFSAAFDEEANFCAGATQIHTHSPTCVKYSLSKDKRAKKRGLCRFQAPWRLVEKTAFTADGVLHIRRSIACKDEIPAAWGEVSFENEWGPGRGWLQVLRRPGKHASVCLDGYLSKDFDQDDEEPCYRRAAVQHLALFVPWESFLCRETDDINSIWARARKALPPRISCLVDNVQLLRRSAEDAKRDARQWAASSGDGELTATHAHQDRAGEAREEATSAYQSDSVGNATRLIDVVRGAIGAAQITEGSPELMGMMQQLCHFQQSALCSTVELQATVTPEPGERRVSIRGNRFSGVVVPPQGQVKAIKAQQIRASREKEKMIQGIQSTVAAHGTDRSAVVQSLLTGFGEEDIQMTAADFEGTPVNASPSMEVHFDNSFKAEQRHQHDKAHALWKKFTTVVMLDEQVRAAGDPVLQRLLKRIRLGVQDRTDLELRNSRCYREDRRIPWETGITVVTPLNRNRWNLNMEATLAFQILQRSLMRIFISEHKWKDGLPTEEEAIMMLNQGDDSAIPVPAIFMFVPGIPVVVNHNTHQGLKLVNGASYTALEVILDETHPGHRISADMMIHFGPPAGIILESETTKDIHFAGMPSGTVLLTPMSVRIQCQRKRPWQRNDVSRKGLPCAAAFACTDYKVQGRTLERVALELRGTRTTNVDGRIVPSQCDPYSLYVQLSRCSSLDGIMLVSKVRERDLVGNRVPPEMTAAQARLEELSDRTIREAKRWLDNDSQG
ncbi:hypothetical protein FOXG_21800 [Fusarium oxysporum f. sp. lycopersici 4287]|uniref:Helitron helicase-like domain-containing protein n=1 Tax=Fusarium oxysporum f. sp. lycopersici (strain 4287 / CBS 123668 / FGSC 9935 / NRRL 34936) TaxID=426428 RepID=A0A0J9W191_FUSO4|nr:hypothetical protein FOXG_21800 [Fusarium oxysporum f. sp. lycopersici 4287]KNB16808.1 hypothetical protein FOXG_21800 [Fusarium oxysporum f. sp. lycopersici 4287]